MTQPTVIVGDGTEHVLPNPKKDDVLYTLAEPLVLCKHFIRRIESERWKKSKMKREFVFSSQLSIVV